MLTTKFRKFVSEGYIFLSIVALFAIITRIVFFFNANTAIIIDNNTTNFAWSFIVQLLENQKLASILIASFYILGMSLLAYRINIDHVFIRVKTTLPISLMILLFSYDTRFFLMNFEFVSASTLLIITYYLFAAYNSNTPQIRSLNVSFVLAIGSIFDLSLLLYLPILWIALILMRCFNFKAFLSSFFALGITYIPIASYFYLTNNIDGFYKPFRALSGIWENSLPLSNLSIITWGVLGLMTLLFLIIIVNYYMNSYKDKVKNRAQMACLVVLLVFSLFAFFLVSINSSSFIYVAVCLSTLIFAHFFALADANWKVVIFIILCLTLISFYIFV